MKEANGLLLLSNCSRDLYSFSFFPRPHRFGCSKLLQSALSCRHKNERTWARPPPPTTTTVVVIIIPPRTSNCCYYIGWTWHFELFSSFFVSQQKGRSASLSFLSANQQQQKTKTIEQKNVSYLLVQQQNSSFKCICVFW